MLNEIVIAKLVRETINGIMSGMAVILRVNSVSLPIYLFLKITQDQIVTINRREKDGTQIITSREAKTPPKRLPSTPAQPNELSHKTASPSFIVIPMKTSGTTIATAVMVVSVNPTILQLTNFFFPLMIS